MNNDTHPLLAAADAAFERVGAEHSRRIHKRQTQIVQRLANLLGVRVELSQGMGAYSVNAPGAVYRYEDDPNDPGTLGESDCLLDYVGAGYARLNRSDKLDRMTPEVEALLRECGQLCDALSGGPYLVPDDASADPS